MSDRTLTACYRELGAELKKLRESAGLNEIDVSRKLSWSPSKVSRMENGFRKIAILDLIDYIALCGIYGKHGADYHAMCREAELNQGHWLRMYENGLPDTTRSLIYHESNASASTSYETEFVPGLLQTEAYIRALTTDRFPDWDPDVAVRIRKERQRVLHKESPARFMFFVHENALRLVVGDHAVMHEQVLALLLHDGLRHVAIRVVPAEAGAQAMLGGPFRLFEFIDHRPLVYLDGPVCGLFLEDGEYVDGYRALLPTLASIALSEGQSREWLAALASEFDREGADAHAAHQVEEE
jgi:transcriptional regulator with XRE-family HTH domain